MLILVYLDKNKIPDTDRKTTINYANGRIYAYNPDRVKDGKHEMYYVDSGFNTHICSVISQREFDEWFTAFDPEALTTKFILDNIHEPVHLNENEHAQRILDHKMDLVDIIYYIDAYYPDSCIAENKIVKEIENLKKEGPVTKPLIDAICLGEGLDFFAYEILRLCSCGYHTLTWSMIYTVLDIQDQYIHVSNSGKDDTISLPRYKGLWLSKLSIDIHEENDQPKIADHISIYQFILYILDDKGLLDHGSNIQYAYLTTLGEMYKYLLGIWIEKDCPNMDEEISTLRLSTPVTYKRSEIRAIPIGKI